MQIFFLLLTKVINNEMPEKCKTSQKIGFKNFICLFSGMCNYGFFFSPTKWLSITTYEIVLNSTLFSLLQYFRKCNFFSFFFNFEREILHSQLLIYKDFTVFKLILYHTHFVWFFAQLNFPPNRLIQQAPPTTHV